ncbi:MAG TPA: hypothetical protein VGX21_15350 [Methylomirabilota bacterium]|jgi:hypothetical protein|nr:hypothetical protein [Methylomirabilota bacterium]
MRRETYLVCWRCHGVEEVMTEDGWVRCPVCTGPGRPLAAPPAGGAGPGGAGRP